VLAHRDGEHLGWLRRLLLGFFTHLHRRQAPHRARVIARHCEAAYKRAPPFGVIGVCSTASSVSGLAAWPVHKAWRWRRTRRMPSCVPDGTRLTGLSPPKRGPLLGARSQVRSSPLRRCTTSPRPTTKPSQLDTGCLTRARGTGCPCTRAPSHPRSGSRRHDAKAEGASLRQLRLSRFTGCRTTLPPVVRWRRHPIRGRREPPAMHRGNARARTHGHNPPGRPSTPACRR
jgi:hypothetical protein